MYLYVDIVGYFELWSLASISLCIVGLGTIRSGSTKHNLENRLVFFLSNKKFRMRWYYPVEDMIRSSNLKLFYKYVHIYKDAFIYLSLKLLVRLKPLIFWFNIYRFTIRTNL